MANTTVPSAWGPLTIHHDDHPSNPAWKLPSLQFDDFDLVIKLDDDPESWLLVHSDLVRKCCQNIAPSFSESWEKRTSSALEKIQHPRTGELVLVKTRALKRVEHTWMVEGPGVLEDEDHDGVLFCQSDLAEPGWSDIVPYCHDALHMTKRSLRLFFTLLYSPTLGCEQLCTVGKDNKVTPGMINEEVLPLLANACAYVEYFGVWVANTVIPILTSSTAYGEAIALEPMKHCLFAKKLENLDLYRDALRHMIAQAHPKGYWHDIAEITGWDEDKVSKFFTPQCEALQIQTQKLREDLGKLQLGQVSAKSYGGDWYSARTRLLDMIAVEEKPSRPEVVAGFIYGEYLTYELSGEKVSKARNGIRAEAAGRLNLLIHKIQKAFNSPNKASLFDAAAAVRFSAMFKLSKRELRGVEMHLSHLVYEANWLIEDTFPTVVASGYWMDGYEQDMASTWNLSGYTTTRAQYDAHYSGYFTYLKVPDMLPWDPASRDDQVVIVPSLVKTLNTTEVTPEWMPALRDHYEASK